MAELERHDLTYTKQLEVNAAGVISAKVGCLASECRSLEELASASLLRTKDNSNATFQGENRARGTKKEDKHKGFKRLKQED